MRSLAAIPLLFLVACGGGSGGGDPDAFADNQGEGTGGETRPTAAALFADCFQQDVTVLAQVLEVLGSFVGENPAGVPAPTVDLVGGLLGGGVFPYTWDLDGDGTNELSGSFRFIDRDGRTTIPFSLNDLQGLDPNDPASLLDAVPAGSRMELRFVLGGLLLAGTNGGAGDATLVLTFGEGGIDDVSGNAALSSGECALEIEFDDITLDLAAIESYPVADVAFTASVGGTNSLEGSISLDGTSTAAVTASLDGGPVERFTFELPDLSDLPVPLAR